MKKIIPILLFFIICLNHLHISEVIGLGSSFKKDCTQTNKTVPGDNDQESKEEDKEKEKTGEQEKFITRSTNIITNHLQLQGSDTFICFSTRLHTPPYHEDDIQPPNAV